MESKKAPLYPQDNQTEEFHLPECHFAATCGDCYWNDGGWCKKHGGWVDIDKWACSSFA